MKSKSRSAARKLPEDFYDMVYEVVRLVPKGRVTTFGAIAKYLGAAGASRIVGYAMNGSHRKRPKVPAHRVVNRNGLLSGKLHFANPFEMQELLEKEKVKVVNDRVVEFRKLYWDPNIELAL